eukprot:3404600-Amphidinium_carterae.1
MCSAWPLPINKLRYELKMSDHNMTVSSYYYARITEQNQIKSLSKNFITPAGFYNGNAASSFGKGAELPRLVVCVCRCVCVCVCHARVSFLWECLPSAGRKRLRAMGTLEPCLDAMTRETHNAPHPQTAPRCMI